MIRNSIFQSRGIAPASARPRSAMSGFARETAEKVSDFASLLHNLVMDVRDSYRPELHYMRGPGPKWRARHLQSNGSPSSNSTQAADNLRAIGPATCVGSNRSASAAIALGQRQI